MAICQTDKLVIALSDQVSGNFLTDSINQTTISNSLITMRNALLRSDKSGGAKVVEDSGQYFI